MFSLARMLCLIRSRNAGHSSRTFATVSLSSRQVMEWIGLSMMVMRCAGGCVYSAGTVWKCLYRHTMIPSSWFRLSRTSTW